MADPAQPQRQGTNWRHWLIGISAVILIVFFALNSKQVEVNFIVGTAKTPLIFALLIATVLGLLIGWLGPRVRRGGRERHDQD
jgi:uncharacterized integral membrane protein